jgi:hypothetical protein
LLRTGALPGTMFSGLLRGSGKKGAPLLRTGAQPGTMYSGLLRGSGMKTTATKSTYQSPNSDISLEITHVDSHISSDKNWFSRFKSEITSFRILTRKATQFRFMISNCFSTLKVLSSEIGLKVDSFDRSLLKRERR